MQSDGKLWRLGGLKMGEVKFCSINNMMCGYYLENSENLIKEYKAGKKVQDINDSIELYNIKKYFDNKIYLLAWTPDDIKCYENTIKLCFEWQQNFSNQ